MNHWWSGDIGKVNHSGASEVKNFICELGVS